MSAAVQYGSLAVIQKLFACNGSIEHGQLLHYAVWRKVNRDRLDIVRLLLRMGAPPNAVMYHDKPASYSQRESFGLGTPLHDAAANGDMEVVQELVESGADPCIQDTLGELPHERAQANNHGLVAQFLLSRLRSSRDG